MNNDIKQKKTSWIYILRYIENFITKNIGYKVLALFLAIAFWAGLVSQAPNITRDKKFTNVLVNFTGAETLKRNGLIVTNEFDDNPITVDFNAQVPQMQYQNARATHFAPKIDLSGITEPGKISLDISTNSSVTYGNVSSITPSNVELNVDTYITQYRIPVQFEQKNDFNDGFYGTEPYLDPLTINVSGPSSIVKNIAKAVVFVDVSKYPKKEGIIKTSVRFKLIDNDGKEINNKLIEVSSDSRSIKNILVTQHQYAMQTYKISANSLISGEVKDNYYIKSVSISPSIVFVAGNRDLLNNIKNIYFNENIDVKDRYRSITKTLKLNIPNEAVYASARSAVVDVEIVPIIKDKLYKNIPVNLIGKKENYEYSLDIKNVDLILTDELNILNSIKDSHINVYADVSNLEIGKHEVELKLELNNNIKTSENFVFKSFPSSALLSVEDK